MRYLFTALLLLAINANAQSKRLRPYMDMFVNAGVLFPSSEKDTRAYTSSAYIQHANLAGIGEWGCRLIMRNDLSPVTLSLGGRIGYIGLTSKSDSGNVQNGKTIHGSFTLGIEYVHHSYSSPSFRIGAVAGGGLRPDGSGNSWAALGMPFAYGELSGTYYFNKFLGAGLAVCKYYYLNTPYSYIKYSSTLYDGSHFNPWSVSAHIALSIKRARELKSK